MTKKSSKSPQAASATAAVLSSESYAAHAAQADLDGVFSTHTIQQLDTLADFSDWSIHTASGWIHCSGAMMGSVSKVMRSMFLEMQKSRKAEVSLVAKGICTVSESLLEIAPIFELAYGDIHFEVTSDNLRAVMYCHDKYDCPSLGAASRQYLDHQLTCLTPSTAIPILCSISEFGIVDKQQQCIDWMANHLDAVMETGSEIDCLSSELKGHLFITYHKLCKHFFATNPYAQYNQYGQYHNGIYPGMTPATVSVPGIFGFALKP